MAQTSRRIGVLAIAFAIALIPAVLFAAWAIVPIVGAVAQAAQAQRLTERFRLLKAEEPGYRLALRKAKAELVSLDMPDPAMSAELVGAALQNTMQSLIAQAGAQVTSSDILPPQTLGGLQAITVSLSFNLPPNHLASFLTLIDTENPYLSVQSLDVRSQDNGTGTGLLSVELQVAEYRVTQ